ncbi:hypothetical protein KW798_01725 [Candidatus Parcubacteria bacterium]|nr:hypothetical protein [Candidatus Parcubacteria bacterium]
MIKKIFYVVVLALVIFALLALIWLFFGPKQQDGNNTGDFGSAGNRSLGNSSGAGSGTNLGTQLPGSGSTSGGTGGASSGGSGVTTGVGTTMNGVVGVNSSSSFSGVQGVTWVPGGTGGALSGSGRVFTPSEINQLNGANGGLPNLISTGSGTGGIGLGTALLGAGIAGAISCGAKELFATGARGTAGVTATGLVAAGTAGTPVGNPTFGWTAGASVVQAGNSTADQNRSFASCILNTIAKVALQQMTASIVNWINSGFNGKPGFVQNFQQFFTNVADQAAGEFIRGSGLAFLCTNFKAQIRVAIAQAYANRNAASCSLSSIIKNVNSFQNGNFGAGGWGGFLGFTTMPLNNPYGSYVAGQISLGNYQAQKVLEQSQRLQQGQGFLPVTKQTQCTGFGGDGKPIGCREIIVTPGTTVARAIDKQLGAGTDQLGLGNSLDQIINALVTQLMSRALMGGLAQNSTVSSDPALQAAMAQAQALLNEMQSAVNAAQQFGSIKQGAINDVQQVQDNFNDVFNCWTDKGNSSSATAAQGQIDSLQHRIDLLNAQITTANEVIAELQDFQTELSLATNAAGISAVQNSFNTAKANGDFILAADVTSALQDRQTLQADMTTLNNQANAQMNQCRGS